MHKEDVIIDHAPCPICPSYECNTEAARVADEHRMVLSHVQIQSWLKLNMKFVTTAKFQREYGCSDVVVVVALQGKMYSSETCPVEH